jgi:hypothetical protein
MNERIKQLWDDAALASGDESKTWDGQVAFMALFAELIVKECLSLGDVLSKHYINTHPEQKQAWLLASIADYKNEIKKHFGVEE